MELFLRSRKRNELGDGRSKVTGISVKLFDERSSHSNVEKLPLDVRAVVIWFPVSVTLRYVSRHGNVAVVNETKFCELRSISRDGNVQR